MKHFFLALCFTFISTLQAQYFVVSENNFYGLIDTKGAFVKPLIYSSIRPGLMPESWILVVETDDKTTSEYVDNSFKSILKINKWMERYGDFIISKSDDKKYNYYNKNGKLVSSLPNRTSYIKNWNFNNKKLSHVSGKEIAFDSHKDLEFIDSTKFLGVNIKTGIVELMNFELKVLSSYEKSSKFHINENKKCYFVNFNGTFNQYDFEGNLKKSDIVSSSCPKYYNSFLVTTSNLDTKILYENGTELTLTNGNILEMNKLNYSVFYTNDFVYLLDPNFKKFDEKIYRDLRFFNDTLSVGVDTSGNNWLINLKTKKTKQLLFKNSDFEYSSSKGLFVIYNQTYGTGEGSTETQEELMKTYGSVQDIYIDHTGKVIWKSKPYYSCFPAGSKVATQNGSISIENIKRGDKVIAFENGNAIETEVENLQIHNGNFSLIKLSIVLNNSFANNITTPTSFEELTLTPNHPVLTESGYIPASKLESSMKIKIISNNLVYEGYLYSKTKIEKNEKIVYNVKTKAGNYVVGSVVVFDK